MGFADLLGKLAGYLDASKLLTLSVPGTLFVIGVLLLIDFPLPSFLEQRRQTRVVVDTSTADHQARDSILLEARDSLWRDLRDSSLRVQRDRFESVMARRDTIERGHRAPVLLTFRARDSLERIARHDTFKLVIRSLDSLAVHQRRDSVQRGGEEALRVALATDFATKVGANSMLARDVQMQINVSDRRSLELADRLALRAMDMAKWRRDSVRLAPDLAVIDSSWAGFQGSGGFAETLGSLGTDFLIILFMGIVIGTILDPINKNLYASVARAKPTPPYLRKVNPDLVPFVNKRLGRVIGDDEEVPDAPLFEFVARGLVKTEQQDYLVTFYYRFAELTHALIIPAVVLLAGLARALSPAATAANSPLLWLAFVVGVGLSLAALRQKQEDCAWPKGLIYLALGLWLLAVVVVAAWDPLELAWWAARAFGAAALSALVMYWLLVLAWKRHKTYRVRQWEMCWGADKALEEKKDADAKQMEALRDDVNKLGPRLKTLESRVDALKWRSDP